MSDFQTPMTENAKAIRREQLLGDLANADQALQAWVSNHQSYERYVIRVVLDLGASWGEIGEALGISKHAARERFGGR